MRYGSVAVCLLLIVENICTNDTFHYYGKWYIISPHFYRGSVPYNRRCLMKKSIFGLFKRIGRHVRTPNVSYRELEADLDPAVLRAIISFIHRDERSERSRVRWRRLTFLLLFIVSLFGWMKWSEETNREFLIDQKPFRTIALTGSGWKTAHVAVIPIRGSIDGDPLGPAEVTNTPRYLYDTLKLAKKESNLAAIVVYINSRGGDMYASAESYRLIYNFTKSMKIPVYAYIPRGAYSGAYYIALGTGEIIADPVAEIGNIGVIVSRFNTYSFGRQFGIKMDTVKTGKHKDAGDQWKRPNAFDRAIEQRAVDVVFEQFLQAVAMSRSRYSLEELKAEVKKNGSVTSGAWFASRDAKEKGLIDKIMTFEEFLAYVTQNIAKNDGRRFHNAEFVKYDEKLSILGDWKSRLKKSQMPASSSKEAAKGNISGCVFTTNILDRIFESDE